MEQKFIKWNVSFFSDEGKETFMIGDYVAANPIIPRIGETVSFKTTTGFQVLKIKSVHYDLSTGHIEIHGEIE